jgi:hypothetical protein
MSDQERVRVYDSRGPEYGEAFAVFLAHTDQKAKATAWLDEEVNRLGRRDVFIDAGAGNGKLTGWLQPRFRMTIAIEPNSSLRDELQNSCPAAEVLPVPIAEARPGSPADFVLCSHVFYYLDRGGWAEHLLRLTDWLGPGGVLAVALQNHETDCMRMLRHFTGQEFDLGALARSFAAEAQGRFAVRTDTVEAHIETDSFEAAYTVAEFMLNLLPLRRPPQRTELEAYVRDHFHRGRERYRFSCHQDFLRVCRTENSATGTAS